jgi:hypothetical protein
MKASISEFLELVDKKNNLFLFISLSEGEPKADKLILFVLESHQVYSVSKMICNTYTFINQRLS